MICQHCKKEEADYSRKPFHWSAGDAYILEGLEPFWFHRSCYKPWYDSLVAGLAELDEVMNYCKYFERTEGNDGFYVRDGKSFPVKGNWDGYELPHDFKEFLTKNGWRDNWFKLRDKYKALVD